MRDRPVARRHVAELDRDAARADAIRPIRHLCASSRRKRRGKGRPLSSATSTAARAWRRWWLLAPSSRSLGLGGALWSRDRCRPCTNADEIPLPQGKRSFMESQDEVNMTRQTSPFHWFLPLVPSIGSFHWFLPLVPSLLVPSIGPLGARGPPRHQVTTGMAA